MSDDDDRKRKMKMVQLYDCPDHRIQIAPRCAKCRPCKTPQLFSFGNDKGNAR
jgi:hypothetical protein